MSNLPIITVFCAITRPHYMERWFEDIYSTDLEPEKTNLCFIIDGEFPKAYDLLKREMEAVKWRKFLILRNTDHEVHEGSVPLRRKRIAEIHEQAKGLIAATDGEFVLEIEDDTVFTNLVVSKLYRPFLKYGDSNYPVGLTTAFQAGRWSRKMVGIWHMEDRLAFTVTPHDYGKFHTSDDTLESITAAGFYCYLTPASLFLNHTFDSDIKLPWGPDAAYGYDVWKKGYRNLVDWDCPVGHRTDQGIINPMHNAVSERFVLTEIGWERQVLQ